MNIKRVLAVFIAVCFVFAMLAGCSSNKKGEDTSELSGLSDVTSDSDGEFLGTTGSGDETTELTSYITQGTTQQTTKAKTTTQPTEKQSVSVTIPEGYSFMQIANTLEDKGVCTAKEFYKAAQSYQVKSFTIPSSSDRCFKLEGYLFPDTYEFYKNDDPKSVIIKTLNNYAAKSGMPTDRQLIIASIIEKEVRSDSQMKMVASVFYNRLDAGMRLESDPTREYVNDYITGNSLLSGNTSKYAGLYNTYKCKLPAGPICSPGARAIEAAKNPASSDYLYFFFGNDNKNHYSKTYDEHEKQMEKYGVQYGD